MILRSVFKNLVKYRRYKIHPLCLVTVDDGTTTITDVGYIYHSIDSNVPVQSVSLDQPK